MTPHVRILPAADRDIDDQAASLLHGASLERPARDSEGRLSDSEDLELNTAGGEFPLFEYRLHHSGREWTVLHAGAVLTDADETHAIVLKTNRIPYGVSLWPSAIGLSHEIATRADAFRGRSMLELGAGIGLPGIVAASVGAKVLQTDRDELVAHLGKRNSRRNGLDAVEYRLADWTAWDDAERYDWIVGSDILYSDTVHPHLRHIFESNLAPGGKISTRRPVSRSGLPVPGNLGSSRLGRLVHPLGRGPGGEPTPGRSVRADTADLTADVKADAAM